MFHPFPSDFDKWNIIIYLAQNVLRQTISVIPCRRYRMWFIFSNIFYYSVYKPFGGQKNLMTAQNKMHSTIYEIIVIFNESLSRQSLSIDFQQRFKRIKTRISFTKISDLWVNYLDLGLESHKKWTFVLTTAGNDHNTITDKQGHIYCSSFSN